MTTRLPATFFDRQHLRRTPGFPPMAFAHAFDSFFLHADVDRDGRISGVEALNFFRAADLPQRTLAQIWEFSNQDQTGFLSRQEFYNALKLATVAQTGRELTPELVKAALTGPAAAQIPPPRIKPTPPSASFEGTGSPPQISPPTPLQANYIGQHFSPQSGMAPDLGHQGSAYPESRLLPPYEGSVAKRHLLQTNRASSVGSVPRAGATWPSLTTSSVPSEVQLPRFVGLSVDSCPQQSSTAGLSTVNAFQNALDSASNAPCAANAPNFQGGTQSARPVNAGPPKSSSNPELHGLGEFFRANSLVGDMAENCSPRPLSASSTESLALSQAVVMTSNPGICGYDGRQLGATAPAPNSPWPKMTPSDTQRFVHVFSQVDTDHDGKITGEQARQLFRSRQLPREVLRHVWNLSDEDGDSMLSVREFCTAVYLLEKFTEGWPLPLRLPMGIHLDEPPTPVRREFAPEVLGSGESSWRLPQGSWLPTDFVFEPGVSSAPECYALFTTSARHLQDPLSSAEVTLERGSYVPHANSHFIKQNRESEEALTPTLSASDKLVTIEVADLTKHIMSQKEKAEFYRLKLQEIVLSRSQCGNELAEMTERVIVLKHEVNTLNQQYYEKSKSASDVETEIAAEVSTLTRIQEKKRELSRALLRLDSESRMSDSYLQTQLDHIAVDLHKLRKILFVRAKSLGVEINRELPEKTPFGWQPNIQEKAAEWKNGWDTFNDEGFTEVQGHISPTPGAALLAISTGGVSAAASGNVEGENALEEDIVDCGLHSELSQRHSSVLESSAAASGSITTTGASTTRMPVCNDKPTAANETSTDNAVHINCNKVSDATVAAEALTKDVVDTRPGTSVESACETLTTAGVNTFAISVPPSKSYAGAESRLELGSSTTSDAFGGNETLQKMGQNDDNHGSSLRSAWELRSNSQCPAEIKASGKALRSIGSFEPEDYFDLSPPRDLSVLSPSSGSSALASEHTANCKSPAGHDNFEAFGFLAYSIKESRGSSPIFTTSATQPFDTSVHTDHGPDEYPRENLAVYDESGSDAASPR